MHVTNLLLYGAITSFEKWP